MKNTSEDRLDEQLGTIIEETRSFGLANVGKWLVREALEFHTIGSLVRLADDVRRAERERIYNEGQSRQERDAVV